MQFYSLVPEFKQFCLREKGLQVKSYKTIIQHLQAFIFYLDNDNVKVVKTKQLREYLYTMSRNRAWSAKTFRNHLQSIATFYDWAIKKHYLSFNPTRQIEKPKLPTPLPRYLTVQQVAIIMQQSQQTIYKSPFITIRNHLIIATFLQTGIRLNELRHLQYQDVNLQEKTLCVQKGKGNKMRLIPIHPHLLPLMERYISILDKRRQANSWLFPSCKQQAQISAKYIHQLCRKLSIQSGIKFTPHMLRHTFGRNCTDQNLPFFKLKQMMGHSSITTTERYASISMKGLQESFYRINFL